MIKTKKRYLNISKQLIGKIIVATSFFIVSLFYRLILWMHLSLAGITLDAIIFELNVPLKGTNTDTIWSAILFCCLPVILLTMLLIYVLYPPRAEVTPRSLQLPLGRWKITLGSYPLRHPNIFLLGLTAAILTLGIFQSNSYFGLFSYIDAQIHPSSFIQTNYKAPSSVTVQFPENKRNLIYIYLESIESTYADTASGGGFAENYIPELTKLAEENINFSNNALLGGALPVPGTQWTIGALFSSSTGLPLLLPVELNSMSDYKEFFPGVTSLGDILYTNGYRNVFFIGSDAEFGGRRSFYTQHGQYDIFDCFTAKEENLIPDDYNVWWGYEDEKLFKYAKDKLLELSQSSQPFNFTLLTADTHFPDGYICPLCHDDFDCDYANVIACSSKQVYQFVRWIQQQDFYPNTTIVISGDHATMNTSLCENVLPDDRSVYDCFINAAPAVTKAVAKNRHFSSLDLFPTVLAALGVKINGDQLGLGVNLFSGKPTLYEQYGSLFYTELDKRSDYYNDTFVFSD